MASKQVSEILIKLGIDGLQGLDKLKSSFRELEKSIGPSAATIERARESIIAYGKEGRNSEQVIKGQVEALKGLRSQTERGSAIWAELTRDIENFRQASRRTDEEISVLRESILSVAAGSNQSQQSLRSYIADLGRLRNEATITGSVFSALGNDISELTARLEQAETQTTQTGRAFGRVLGQALASTSAGARKQIQDLKLLIDEQQEFIDNIDSLASRERRLKDNVEARAAAQERLNRALAQQRQLTFQESARAGRQTVRSAAAAFADPAFLRTISPEALDKRLGELPNTTAGLNQGLSELSERLANTTRNTTEYLVVAMQMAGMQRELTAVTQGYAQALLMGIRTGTVAPSARNLQEVITALRAEMSQLDVTTSEGARAYAENASQARALEQQLKGLANAYRHVGDMATEAATAQTSEATARVTANYLNRSLIRQQEQAMAELGQRVRAGVAATSLALPAAGQTTAPGTGLQISGGARAGRPSPGILRFFTRADVGDAGTQMPGAPQAYGPQATEQQVERARRAAISEAEAVRTAAEARQQAERQIQSYRAEIDKARRADIGSIDSTQRLREAINQYRSTLPGASAEFKKLTKELGELDARSEKLGRGLARRRMTGMQVAQAAGAAVSGGIFGGPEGFFGGALGGIFGGVGGAFAGAAAGAQVGALRQQLGGFADYAAQIQKMEIALKNAAGSQDQFNQAMAAASAATRNLNVPQDVAIQGMTKLTAAVKGAGGQVSDAELVFKNVTAAIKATGGSAQDVDGAITAMVQVFSKGKVSAEELSGQLGERLPGAVTKFAKANDMTLPELQKALEQGQVGLNELMNFIVQLGDEYAGVAEKIAGSSQDAGARLTVAYNNMRVAVGEALQPIGAQFQEAFIPFIENITPILVDVLPKIGNLAVQLAKNFDDLAVAVAAFGATLAAVNVASFVANAGGIVGALVKVKAAFVGATAAMTGFAAASAAVPWIALATGAAAAAVAIYNASNAQQDFNNKIYEAPITEVKNEILKLQSELIEAEEKLQQTAVQFGTLSKEAAFAQAKVDGLRGALDQARGDYRIRLLYQEVGVTPDSRYFGPGFAAPAEQEKPSEFPRFDTDKTGAGKTKKERESQLPQLMAELAVRRQIAQIDERIDAAQLMENQLLQIRLEGEKQIIQLAGRYKAIQFEKIPEDEKEIKRLLVMEDIERARLDIAQKLAMAARQTDKDIATTTDQLKESYEDQIFAAGRLEELTSTGMTEALAQQYIEIEKIIDKQKERYEEEIRYREAIVALGGPGAVEAEAGIDLFRKRLAGLGGREAELKGLAGAAQPTEIGKIQQFIEQAEAELKDFEAMAVRISQNIGDAIGSSISNGISGLIEGTTNVKEIFANLLKDIGQILVQEGAKMIATYIAIGIAKAFAGLDGGSSVVQGKDIPLSALPPGMAFANGEAFAQNGIQPFANGGIVTKPTFFKYADGGTFSNGVMGEAGPEAIMPLKRGADGRLGVTIADTRAALAEQSAARSTNDTRAMLEQQSAARQANATGMALQQQPIDVRYESTVINQTEYVTAEQHRKGLAQAAERGRALTLAALQNSTRTRKKVGI